MQSFELIKTGFISFFCPRAAPVDEDVIQWLVINAIDNYGDGSLMIDNWSMTITIFMIIHHNGFGKIPYGDDEK